VSKDITLLDQHGSEVLLATPSWCRSVSPSFTCARSMSPRRQAPTSVDVCRRVLGQKVVIESTASQTLSELLNTTVSTPAAVPRVPSQYQHRDRYGSRRGPAGSCCCPKRVRASAGRAHGGFPGDVPDRYHRHGSGPCGGSAGVDGSRRDRHFHNDDHQMRQGQEQYRTQGIGHDDHIGDSGGQTLSTLRLGMKC